MATTSPDSLRSPNPGDPYNLIADWAISMSSVQDALVRRANMYVGTSAQRIAFTTAPSGVHWQDTNGSLYEWVRVGNAWRGAKPISGQTTITPPANGGKTTVSVPLPSGMFSPAPIVVVSGASVAPELISVGASATTTAISITLNRTNGVATPVNWIVAPSS